jgi:hypothetical protein
VAKNSSLAKTGTMSTRRNAERSNTQNQQQMDFENLNCIKFNLTDTACIPRVISSLSRLKTALPDYSPKLQMT